MESEAREGDRKPGRKARQAGECKTYRVRTEEDDSRRMERGAREHKLLPWCVWGCKRGREGREQEIGGQSDGRGQGARQGGRQRDTSCWIREMEGKAEWYGRLDGKRGQRRRTNRARVMVKGGRLGMVVGGNIRAPSIPDSHSGLREPHGDLMSSPAALVRPLRTAPLPSSPLMMSPPITQH